MKLPRGALANGTAVVVTSVGVTLPEPPANLSERAWQEFVVAFARSSGWRCVWFRPARVVRGGREKYETPVGGDGAGWPDVVFVKAGKPVVFAELKSNVGAVRADQAEWIDLLRCTPNQAFVWRPRDWTKVVAVLGESRA